MNYFTFRKTYEKGGQPLFRSRVSNLFPKPQSKLLVRQWKSFKQYIYDCQDIQTRKVILPRPFLKDLAGLSKVSLDGNLRRFRVMHRFSPPIRYRKFIFGYKFFSILIYVYVNKFTYEILLVVPILHILYFSCKKCFWWHTAFLVN